MSLLFRPPDSAAADFIPFYWKGQYHLFYLRDYRDPKAHGEGTPWWHIVTSDFLHFEDWGEALPRGPAGSQDLWVFTGSVIEHRGCFHIFYTGHNHHRKDAGKPVEAILHATSPDLRRWTKDPAVRFFAPRAQGYESDDWRDPFVFRDPRRPDRFGMLIAARQTRGPSRHRGCTAFATSRDLQRWTVRAPFWAPQQYFTHECPDLFRLGPWWYLLYSTFSDRCLTHYRRSRHLEGPWQTSADDAFDGRAWYAAKTAGDGAHRYGFGWLASRAGEKDDGAWQWGGDLVVHEIVQQPDGTLAVRLPASLRAAFAKHSPLHPKAILGRWSVNTGRIAAEAVGRFSALRLARMPAECLAEVSLRYEPGTQSCGLLLRAKASLDAYYQVRLEPPRQRLVVDGWPRPGHPPFLLERPLPLRPGRPCRLRVLVDGTCLVVYADDRVALSCRLYDHATGDLGLFVGDGHAAFEQPALLVR